MSGLKRLDSNQRQDRALDETLDGLFIFAESGLEDVVQSALDPRHQDKEDADVDVDPPSRTDQFPQLRQDRLPGLIGQLHTNVEADHQEEFQRLPAVSNIDWNQ